MKILIFWDIYWRIGRKAISKKIGELKEKYSPDFVIANVDNATSWKWIIEKHALYFENLWVDLMTSWDHIFDNFEKIKEYLKKQDSKIIIPANLYNNTEIWNKWYSILNKNWKKLLVIHLLDEIFMPHKVYNPFLKAAEIIEKLKNEKLDWIIIDFHKEVSSSIYGMLYYLKNKVSFLYGTHTHIQANDDHIFDWVWIINDIWMTWPFNSVIWADYKTVKNRFLTGVNKWKIEQSLDKTFILNAVFIEIENFKTTKIEKIKIIDKL